VVSPIINWPVISKRPETSAGFFVLTALISIAIQIFLIRQIVRRKNWARWIIVVLMGVGTALSIVIAFVRPYQHNGLAGNAIFYLCYVTAIIAAYFLLTSEAWAWFRLSFDEATARDPSDIRLQP